MSRLEVDLRGDASGYAHPSAALGHHHRWILPAVERTLRADGRRRVFDLGCGNGSVCARLAALGFDVVGVDPSDEGIRAGRAAYPGLDLHRGSGYEPLAERFGAFPVVISLDVVEHLYDPRAFVRTVVDLLEPGGIAILSTPYHGYLKNVALAVTGSLDRHLSPLWDHGHIKFWSIATLRQLLGEAGLTPIRFERLGRVPPLARSLLAVGLRPADRRDRPARSRARVAGEHCTASRQAEAG